MPHIDLNPEYNSRLYQVPSLNSASSAGLSNYADNTMGYSSYPGNMEEGYRAGGAGGGGDYQQHTSVPIAIGNQRCSSLADERNSSNLYNLTTSRNPFSNSVSNSHEYYSLQNMDQRQAYGCPQSDSSRGQANSRRSCRANSENSAARKSKSWTDAVFATMDREAESILDLVNEDAMELERIAATIKQVGLANLLFSPRYPSRFNQS